MSFSQTVTLDISGDVGLFERVAKAHRNTRPLMMAIGLRGLRSAVGRLESVLNEDADVRTGALGASIRVDDTGRGNADSIFELSDDSVTVGSNLVYAAQVHFGGRIEPKAGNKALAIPLPVGLKRDKRSPRDLDPNRDVLRFVPFIGGASGNVFGGLVDDENEFGFGEDEMLFVLARFVDQPPRPFLFWDDDDKRTIRDDLFPIWLEGAA